MKGLNPKKRPDQNATMTAPAHHYFFSAPFLAAIKTRKNTSPLLLKHTHIPTSPASITAPYNVTTTKLTPLTISSRCTCASATHTKTCHLKTLDILPQKRPASRLAFHTEKKQDGTTTHIPRRFPPFWPGPLIGLLRSIDLSSSSRHTPNRPISFRVPVLSLATLQAVGSL